MSNRRMDHVFLFFSTTYKPSGTIRPVELAYVQWFKLITNGWNAKTEMFKVMKTSDFGVIEIGSIERGVYLVPCFQGFNTEIDGIGVRPSLDEDKDFWINNWMDCHIYNMIYADNEKWNAERI